jgi:triosephosphate isomerase
MNYQEKGAFTGEVAPNMVAELCDYVILGHSERRALYGETDESVNLKVEAALKAGLKPIICVGETLAQREAGTAESVVERQIIKALDGVDNAISLVIAYEPVWAIGTGVPATPELAVEIMGGVIQRNLIALYGEPAALAIPLLYGGSVTADSVQGFVEQACIHGALVGGASLKAEEFAQIVRTTAQVKGVS